MAQGGTGATLRTHVRNAIDRHGRGIPAGGTDSTRCIHMFCNRSGHECRVDWLGTEGQLLAPAGERVCLVVEEGQRGKRGVLPADQIKVALLPLYD